MFGDTVTSEAQKNGYLKNNNSFSNPFRMTPLANSNALNNNGSTGADNPYVNSFKRRQPLFKESRFSQQITSSGRTFGN